MPFQVSLDEKQIVTFIAHTNDELFVVKIVDSPHSTFCKKLSGIPIDLLRRSGYVLERSFIVDNPYSSSEVNDISFPDVFLGKFNTNKDFIMIINHRAFLLAKFF